MENKIFNPSMGIISRPGLDYTSIIKGNLPENMDLWRRYQELYIDNGLEHLYDYDWFVKVETYNIKKL